MAATFVQSFFLVAMCYEDGSLTTSCVDGVQFTVFFQQMNFEEAVDFCSGRGMQLARVRNSEQFETIQANLTKDLDAPFAWLGNLVALSS